MSVVPTRRESVANVLLLVAVSAVLFRLWTSFCFFPLPEWNDTRLTPTFMLRFGPTPYPGIDSGPLTTWIYGPIPLLVNLPATLANDAVTALLVSGAINLLIAIVPIAVVVSALAFPSFAISRADRIWAVLLCLTLWPNSNLHYLQADNIAVGFGLVSNVLISRSQPAPFSRMLVAGICAQFAVWSKQTAIGLVLAQLLWVALAIGPRASFRYALIHAGLFLMLGTIFVAWFGFDALWLNLVTIPGQIPWCSDPLDRSILLWKHIAADVLLPAIAILVSRRAIWQRGTPWLLPVLTWLWLVPIGMISIFKIGGASNSLNAHLYLLVPAVLAAISWVKRLTPRSAPMWMSAGIFAITIQQLGASPKLPVQPLTQHVKEAIFLAERSRGRIYFPWHPLITWFSERRIYHSEDGLYTRRIAGWATNPGAIIRDLPPHWSMTAVPGWREDGVFRTLQPGSTQLAFFGKWSVFSWSPAEHMSQRERIQSAPR